MSPLKTIATFVAPLCISGAVLAQSVGDADASPAATPLTRAEVIADLQIWRESGMAAALQTGDADPDRQGAEYRAAEARYAAMRAATFAARVERVARERGDKVDTASAPKV